ncbi:uncharacterized protein LOC126346048 [Schistocerca gregaria]|uniref:uncharacterized protein LOC126346048 n=1 Tax=Schistocerca gregaria TaxID=7010 RepID=UPI00211E6A4A|nr:uncharacterized protein LOC126346048 [Schistocerca gregaria]
MRKTRKQRRDRNVYLSQLALAMAEGQLCPPFNAPPPRELPPICASLFGLFPSGVAVSENPQIHQSGASSFPTKADASGKYWSNADFGKEKSQCNFHTLQAHDENVPEKPPANQSEMPSSSARAGTSCKYYPNVAVRKDKKWNYNINILQPLEQKAFEKPQKNSPEMFSFSTRAGTSGKHRPNFAFEKENNEWNINGETVSQNSQMTLSDMSSFGEISDKSVGLLSESSYVEDESKWANEIQLSPNKF